MTELRTRLAPGRGWVTAPMPPPGDLRWPPARAAADNDAADWPHSRSPHPAPTPRSPDPSTMPMPLPRGSSIPGMEVTELESDTAFDRLFGITERSPLSTRF